MQKKYASRWVMGENKNQLKWVAIELTGRCNLNCIHCRSTESLRQEDSEKPREMSRKQVAGLLTELAELSSPVVVLSGGEPLLRDDVFDIASGGTSLGLRMCIATNGLLVDKSVAGKMKEAGIKMVSLSIDGPTARIHDDFRRQEGAFEGAVNAARILRENGLNFLVNSSFTRRNMEHVEATKDLAVELGATAWYMFMVIPTGRGKEIRQELISGEEYEKLLEWHYKMECKKPPIIVRPTCAPQYFRIVAQNSGSGDGFERRSLKFATGRMKGCLCGQNIALIDRLGKLQPCSYLPISAGNVLEEPLEKIWNESQLLRELRDTCSHGECGVCEYRAVCGGCRARAYYLKDSHLEKDPECSYVPGKAGK